MQINLVCFVCITWTLSLAMTQRIHTQSRTRIYPESDPMVFLVNPPTCCPPIHITLIQTNAQCALGTGTGTKVPRSPRTVSKSCLTLSVTLHFHRLPFLKPDGVPSTRNLAEITSMVTYHSGCMKMMVGSVHQLQYQCRFIAAQRIWVVRTTLSKGSIIGLSFPLCEKEFLIWHMHHSFTMNHMNCDGTRLIGTMT